jgi:hypothetical protein
MSSASSSSFCRPVIEREANHENMQACFKIRSLMEQQLFLLTLSLVSRATSIFVSVFHAIETGKYLSGCF